MYKIMRYRTENGSLITMTNLFVSSNDLKSYLDELLRIGYKYVYNSDTLYRNNYYVHVSRIEETIK